MGGSSPLSFAQIRPLGGQLARVPADATAFANRERTFQLALINDWEEPGDEAAAPHKAWIDAFWQEVRPYGAGVYVNFLELGDRARIREAYPNGAYERLVAIKRQYDPTNFFRLDQNIRPAG